MMEKKMEKKIETDSDWFEPESDAWAKFSNDYEALLHELRGFKIRYWSRCTNAGVRVYIEHDAKVPFTVYNCGASISIRNEGNETWLDIWKDYSE